MRVFVGRIRVGVPPQRAALSIAYSITGIENSPPSLMPDGQRAVTVLVRV